MRNVHPFFFGAWQRFRSFAPNGLGMLLTATIATPILAGVSGYSWQRWLLGLGVGTFILGYFLWRIDSSGRGVVAKPKMQWTTRLEQGCLIVEANYLRTTIPCPNILTAQLVSDEDWDRSPLQEYFCLVVKLRGCPLISVPGSSAGFHTMLEALRQTVPVRSYEMNVSKVKY